MPTLPPWTVVIALSVACQSAPKSVDAPFVGDDGPRLPQSPPPVRTKYGLPPPSTGPRELEGNTPEPPAADQCRSNGDQHPCYLLVPQQSVRLGAQSSDATAPGYDPVAGAEEGPVRQVEVGPFWIMLYEMSVATWLRCYSAGHCPLPADDTAQQHLVAKNNSAPVRFLTYDEAAAVCAFRGGRLPTAEEWEAAARGTDGRRWPWGDRAGCGVNDPDNDRRTGEVQNDFFSNNVFEAMAKPPCTLPPPEYVAYGTGKSPHRLEGMAGSVAEWTSQRAPDLDGRVQHYTRGGGWLDEDPDRLRTTARGVAAADARLPDVGVRCVWGRE